MTSVRADDCKALAQRRPGRPPASHHAVGLGDVAVGASIALVEIAPVPIDRQTHLKADGIVLSVDAHALVHLALDHAVRAGRYGRPASTQRQLTCLGARAGGNGGVGKGKSAQVCAAAFEGSANGRCELRQNTTLSPATCCQGSQRHATDRRGCDGFFHHLSPVVNEQSRQLFLVSLFNQSSSNTGVYPDSTPA